MRNTLLTGLLLSTFLFSCGQSENANEATANTAETAEPNVYGSDFTEQNTLSVTQLQDAVSEQDSVKATVSGVIVESCQSKGCWMDVKLSDNSTMKVTFRDYGFFLPVENLEGKTVVFTGTAKREVISVDDQRHYAEDAGKSAHEIAAINTPREELRFVSDGVKIK
ncbi:DUF4920 domain-containing protein [Pontibacter populi]|uniref:DUF4920 domain-containing protein n=1 Tax=Pontibacter populi TaxID=890055 RepID=A0ABV1RV72_9BACT